MQYMICLLGAKLNKRNATTLAVQPSTGMLTMPMLRNDKDKTSNSGRASKQPPSHSEDRAYERLTGVKWTLSGPFSQSR